MKHLDFVIWLLGWVWLLKGTQKPLKEYEVFVTCFWFIMWISIGSLLYFTQEKNEKRN